MASPHGKSRIVVIGAGITGLQISLFLLEAGYQVTILAEHFPGDLDDLYTSPWAGGQWRSHALPGQEQCGWDLETLAYWNEIFDEELKNPNMPFEEKSGLGRYTSNVYWNEPSLSPELQAAKDRNPSNLWWAFHVSDFAILPGPYPSPGIKAAVTSTSFTFNPPKHIQWLFSRIQAKGGVRIIRTKLPTSQGLANALSTAAKLVNSRGDASQPSMFINATGLGARTLVPDEAVHPIRGQTLLVRGEASKIHTHIFSAADGTADERIAYVVPRLGSGTSIIGGSKQVDVWDTTEDPQLTKDIKSWAKVLAPELCGVDGEVEVLKVQVGLRPGRKGSPRVELERVDCAGEEGAFLVVHAYGHAGAGFQNSVGCARKVVRLVDQALNAQQ